jgi:hypothetical protein
MKPRLILHIGTHKTATSTLQALMAGERKQLRSEGILYPRTDQPPQRNRRKHAFFARLLRDGDSAFEAMLADLRSEVAASGCDRVLMSAEGLSGPSQRPNPAALAALAQAFDITTVCFFRRQDSFAESLWNHNCKIGNEESGIEAFVKGPRIARHGDYRWLLEPWEAVGEVRAVGFEAARQGGVAEAFSAASGAPLPPAQRDLNVSPSMLAASYMAVFNRLGIGFDPKRLAPVVATIHADDPGALKRRALGRRLRALLLERHAEGNAILAARYGVIFPTDMPDEPDEPIALPSATDARRLARAIAAKRVAGKRVAVT